MIKIYGMSCVNCKNKITLFFSQLNEVESVSVNIEKKEMILTYNQELLSNELIEKYIKDLGYEVVKKNNFQSTIIFAFIIGSLGVLIYIINHTIGFNFLPEINQNMSYGMLFIVGIITSLHCVSMCGGINISLSMKNENEGTLQALKPTLLYNIGRVASYTAIGGIVGALGSILSFNGTFKGIISVLAGGFMLVMGIKMLDIIPRLRSFHILLPKLHIKLPSGPFFVGVLNGFMPCGPLQTIQIYALGTGSAFVGALSMFFFSLGTVPLMFLVGLISSFLSVSFRAKAMRFGGILVLTLAFIMMSRGFVLSGLNVGFINKNSSVTTVQSGIQIVESEILSNEYPTITIESGVPTKWIINVKEGNLNGCNNPIYIPEYKIEKELEIGENIIEFTPTEDGTFVYSCWMGMIYGKIVVTK